MQTDGFYILKRAWGYVRHNRFLWPLAFFIAFAGGGSQGYSLWFQSPIPRGLTGYSPMHRVGESISQYAHEHWILTVLLFIAAILVGLAVLAVGVLAQASAIGGVAELDSGNDCDLRRALGWGRDHFFRYLGLVLMYVVLVAALSLPSILYWGSLGKGRSSLWPCAGGLILGLGFVVVSVLAGITLELAGRFVILEEEGIFESLRSAVALFRVYWKDVLVAWVYVLGITIIGIMAMAILLGIIATPLSWIFTTAYRHHNPLLVSLSMVVFVLAWAVISALAGVFSIMSSAVWTLTFIEIEPEAAP